MPVARIRSWTLELPLETPLRLGRMTVHHREYVVVRVDADDVEAPGIAWSLSRGLPVGTAVDAIVAPHCLGAPVGAPARVWQAARDGRGPAGRSGDAMRALSLVDIALWDIAARAGGQPLHHMLGGLHDQVPVMAVSAYPGGPLAPEAAGERLAQLGADGHALVKLARWPDPRDTRPVLARAAAGPARLVADAAWAWNDATTALSELRTWGDVELAWLEDAMPAERSSAYRRLRERCPHPLGVGDEVADAELLAALAPEGAVDVLRIDATVAGGVTGAVRLLGCCWHAGVPVSLHVGLPIHVHLAAASPACIGVEAFVGADAALDPVDRLLAAAPVVTAGRVHVPAGPGLGCELDWELIEHHAHACTDTANQP
jgi:L-alanine-DL-glutamate epimerase-like enolase superfamily enzyme